MSGDPKGYETLIESGQRVRMEGETGSVRRGSGSEYVTSMAALTSGIDWME